MWFSRWFGTKKHPPLRLYNTLGKEKKEFRLSAHAKHVRLYHCGPTVYDVSHIGNLRSYVFADIVRRVLEYDAYKVKQVINITDFGHLSTDADAGEDKMTKALKREGMELSMENMKVLAERYTGLFIQDLRALNIDTDRISFPRASEHVPGEIALIRTLEEKGYAYTGRDGVYYDTSRFPDYGNLGDIDIAGLRAGARIEASPDKKNPTDFLLWKSDKHLGWDSPWGKGFPGWHIECSAMVNATLGKQIDIHTGGVDLMPTHHNNEIAQSEAATGKKPFSQFWLHHEFLNINKEKISKSLGNMINLSHVVEKGFHPLSYRYYLLGAHYRSPLDFSWDALAAAQTSFLKLCRFVDTEQQSGAVPESFKVKFLERINDDLDTPGALALLWETLNDKSIAGGDARACVLEADTVFGLGLAAPDTEAETMLKKLFGESVELEDLPPRVRTLVDTREAARTEKNWEHADKLRNELQKMGYSVEDTAGGPRVFKKE